MNIFYTFFQFLLLTLNRELFAGYSTFSQENVSSHLTLTCSKSKIETLKKGMWNMFKVKKQNYIIYYEKVWQKFAFHLNVTKSLKLMVINGLRLQFEILCTKQTSFINTVISNIHVGERINFIRNTWRKSTHPALTC